MQLPSNASLQDVINELSQLEGINQKSELASVIGSPAAATDTVAQQIVKLQEIKDELAIAITEKGVNTEPGDSLEVMKENVEAISTGEPAYGVASSNSTQMNFDYYSSGSVTSYYLEVSGIPFEPSQIVLVPTTNNNTSQITNYYKNLIGRNNYVLTSIMNNNRSSYPTTGFKSNSNSAYVNATGFRLPVGDASTSYTYYLYK